MRVAITGATGNVGTALIDALMARGDQEGRPVDIVGLARRPPEGPVDGRRVAVRWVAADITRDDLRGPFTEADVVVHLAWAIQPSRDPSYLRRVNLSGTETVLHAAAEAGVRNVVVASSVGAYAPGPKDRAVDETWPTHGVDTSTYSRHKAYQERLVDVFEARHPDTRVVRLRPGLIFRAGVASEVRRFFLGPLFPNWAARPELVPVFPDVPGLRFQAVHSADVGEAFRLAATGAAKGAFNVAADPVLDLAALGRLLEARLVRVPERLLRAGAGATWRLQLQPTPEGWLDLAASCPVMDCERVRRELGWCPQFTAVEAVADLLSGLRAGRGERTSTLDKHAGGPARVDAFTTGVGGRQQRGR